VQIGFDGSSFFQSFGPITARALLSTSDPADHADRKLMAASSANLQRSRIHHLSSHFDGPDANL